MKRLNAEQVLSICKSFINGRGYACYLNLDDDVKHFLIRYNYIYTNKDIDGYYFLNSNFYKNYKKIIDSLKFNKFELELLKDYFALKVIYFDEELMHLFLNNPKLHFVWTGYRGYVCSTDDSKLDVYIKDLCLCHDLENNKIILGAFLCDIIGCSEQSQQLLQPYMLLLDDRKYEIHDYNIKNLIKGEWLEYDEIDIYSVLLEGIKIINYIFEKKYGFHLFKNEYSHEDLQFFMPLFYPTKINRFNFMMELSKIFLDNINSSSLRKKIRREYQNMKNKDTFNLEDLKKEEVRGLKLFKLYFSQYDKFNIKSYEKLDEIRNLRTEPAHKVYKNDLDYSYSVEQDLLLKNLYRILCNIIYVEDPKYHFLKEYNGGNYYSFYGENGKIYKYNGFNEKRYCYYDGYIRLINDKFDVRDSELLIAGNDINIIREKLSITLSRNCNISKEDSEFIIDIILNDEMCVPDKREIESFFYGKAYINKMFGERINYKSCGKKMFNEFSNNHYKYIYLVADSTDLYWNYDKSLKNLKDNPRKLFGCGLLITGLSNQFASNNSNLFMDKSCDFYIANNIWD